MNILQVLSDPALKGVKRRQAVVDLIVSNTLTIDEISAIIPTLDDKLQATLLEALEEVTNKNLAPVEAQCVELAAAYINSPSNACKREASRIVGNLAARYPDRMQQAIPLLMDNTRNEGTVVRWSAAYALSRIIVVPQHAQSGLYDELVVIEAHEEDHGVKQQYTKALKKAQKMRG